MFIFKKPINIYMYIISDLIYLQFNFINIIIAEDLFISILNMDCTEVKQLLAKHGLRRFNKVGKKMGNQIWVHKDFVSDLNIEHLCQIESLLGLLDFTPTIVRFDINEAKIALIECENFDTKNEPIVGKSALFVGGKLSKITNPPADPLIYHHKWLFVSDEYKGFDVLEAMRRSIEWKSILGTNRNISSKIGRKSFWEEWLVANDLKG